MVKRRSLIAMATFQLSLTGLTAIVSSGDDGVSFGPDQLCMVDGNLVPGNQLGSFVASFPASCPYVIAVGATMITDGNTVSTVERHIL